MNNNLVKRYFVIVADRRKGRYFTIFDTAFEDMGEEIIDKDVPQKVKAEGTRGVKIDRHILDHVHRHLKHVGQQALEYLNRQHTHINGVIIGGHHEMLSTIKKNLPIQLQENIIGEFTTDTELSLGELSQKAFGAVQ